MPSVVTNLLNVTFGLLRNKFRDHTAGKLKEEDVMDKRCRQLIVRELDEIKTKLDGLACKDLLSSISFVKEGVVNFSSLSIRRRMTELHLQKISEEDASQTGGLTMKEASNSNCGRNAVFNDALALSHATKKLHIISANTFIEAKSCLKAALDKSHRYIQQRSTEHRRQNIGHETSSDKPNSWKSRRPRCSSCCL